MAAPAPIAAAAGGSGGPATGAASAVTAAASALTAVLGDIEGALEELNCPVCISPATDPVVLVGCGHIGCSQCLSEWLSRKLECPTCRAPVHAGGHGPAHGAGDGPGPGQAKVHALDALLGRLTAASEHVERARADVVLHAGAGGSGGGAGAGAAAATTLERLFRDAVAGALNISMAYVQELESTRAKAIADAKRRHDAMSAALAVSAAGGDASVPEKLARAAAERDTAVAAAEAAYARAYGALVEEARAYLSVAAAPVTLQPATVTVAVPALGLRIEGVRLRPLDTITSAVLPAVVAAASERGLGDTVSYGADARWALEGCDMVAVAAAEGGGGEAGAAAEAAAATPSAKGAAPPDGGAAALPAAAPAADRLDPSVPLFRQCAGGRPAPGTVLLCSGAAAASSSRASRCLTEYWEPGLKADYFWCTTCGLKWICASCAEDCHRAAGHAVSTFLKQHVAAFACCYCKQRSRARCTKPAGDAGGGGGGGGGVAAGGAGGSS